MERPFRRDQNMGVRRGSRPAGPVALTGTPGTGKTTVARRLPRVWQVREVAELAAPSERRAAERTTPVAVDLAALRAAERRRPPAARADVYVGHLAHLLPCRDVVVLRCHPLELRRRLDRARRGSEDDRRENVAAEATDVVLIEALSLRRRVWEVDTSGRPPGAVAREVARLVRTRPPPRYGHVDWLADRRVTDYLLRHLR